MLHRSPAFRRLRARARQLTSGSRVVIFGGGKHTRRCLRAIQLALRPNGTIIAICDDVPERVGSFGIIPVIGVNALAAMMPELVVVSSDTYEATLYQRATEIAPACARIWSIYDAALEAQDRARSCASIEEMKSSIDSIASESRDSTADDREEALIASTNAARR